MAKKQLTRADLKLRFYALMYGCTTPMDIIAAVDFIEETYNLDEGAKEYLASVLERANTMKTGANLKLTETFPQSFDPQKFSEEYKKACEKGLVISLDRELNYGEIVIPSGLSLKDKIGLHEELKLDRDEEIKVVPKSTQSYGRSNIPTDDEITKAYNER